MSLLSSWFSSKKPPFLKMTCAVFLTRDSLFSAAGSFFKEKCFWYHIFWSGNCFMLDSFRNIGLCITREEQNRKSPMLIYRWDQDNGYLTSDCLVRVYFLPLIQFASAKVQFKLENSERPRICMFEENALWCQCCQLWCQDWKLKLFQVKMMTYNVIWL